MQYLKSHIRKLLTLTAVLAVAFAFVSAPRTHAATVKRSDYPVMLFSYAGGSFDANGVTVSVSSVVVVNNDGSTTFKSAKLSHSSGKVLAYGGYVADGTTIIKKLANTTVKDKTASIPLGNVTARKGLPTLTLFDDTAKYKLVLGPEVAGQ